MEHTMEEAADRTLDRTLEDLTPAECFSLLAQHSVGRIAVVTATDEAPLVVPVNYAMDGEAVVFRSGHGTKLTGLRHHRVSFEVDDIDLFHRAGWSVLVRGHAHEATDWEVAHVDVRPWAPGDRTRWVRIQPDAVTGRRIHLPAFVADQRGYV